MSTPQTLIDVARGIINDADSTLYRQSTTDLLGYLNAGMKEISNLKPDLWYTIADLTCTPSQCEQVLSFASAQVIVDVLCIHGGAAVTPFDMMTMNRFNPGWRADTPAATLQWSRHSTDPLRFFVYPPAPATAQLLDVLYVRNPTVLGVGDTIIEIPAAYEPALVDYIVYRAESKDDEHTLSGRAQDHFKSFVSKITGA